MAAADYFRSPSSIDSVEHVPLPTLRRYAAGTAPAHEQYQVERHTLECERCADILAGLLRSDATVTDAAINRLRTRVQQRVAKEVVSVEPLPMWPWRQLAAAALVLLIGTAAFFWMRQANLNTAHTAQKPMAVVSSSAVTEANEIQMTRPQTAAPLAAPSSGAIATAPIKRRAVTIRAEPQSGKTNTLDTPKVALASATQAASTAPKTASATTVGDSLLNTLPSGAKPETPHYAARSSTAIRSLQSDSADKGGNCFVQGRVIDQASGRGIPGAVVRVRGSSAGVVTANDGSFVLQVPSQASTFTIAATGYATREQPVVSGSDTNSLAIALVPMVAEPGTTALVRREKAPTPLAVEPFPAGGYPAFSEYLKREREYPEKALLAQVEGTVRLRFTVSAEGAIQNIGVTQKVSPEIDEEAIRLLREGPKWFPAIRGGRRSAQVVELKIPFVLAENR